MSVVTKTFAAVGNSDGLLLRPGESATVTITGSFTATLQLQRKKGSAPYEVVQSVVGTTLSTTVVNDTFEAQTYRVACTAYTSGSPVATLTDVETDALGKFYVQNGNGQDVLKLTENAVQVNTLQVTNPYVAAGAALTMTKELHDGKIIKLDTAAGSVCTLPNATGSGARYRFGVSVTATSNSHIIKTARAADHMAGFINVQDADGTAAAMYKGDGSADDTITMNRTTTGGVIGDYIEIIDFASNLYLVTYGTITCVAGSNVADPFSATVS